MTSFSSKEQSQVLNLLQYGGLCNKAEDFRSVRPTIACPVQQDKRVSVRARQQFGTGLLCEANNI